MNAAADNLVVGSGTGHNGMTIFSSADADGWIVFNDAANTTLTGAINYNHVNNNFAFYTNAAERMRIDSSGNVGIGTTSPSAKLHIVESASTPAVKIKSGTSTNQNTHITMFNDNDGGTLALGVFGSSASTFGSTTATDAFISANQSLCLNSQNASGAIKFGVGSTPNTKMIIDSSGNIGAPSGSNIFNASDSRLKKNVADINKGLSAIKSLRPVSFNWIDGFCDAEKDTLYGFIAQEVQSIDSNLIQDFSQEITVNGTKIENVLRINEKFIIPMLVKAIQELSAKVEALEAA
tara:strand:- start:176 stop:1054 length:879 start_codon:yes stop_codon:yes gene_type:complete